MFDECQGQQLTNDYLTSKNDIELDMYCYLLIPGKTYIVVTQEQFAAPGCTKCTNPAAESFFSICVDHLPDGTLQPLSQCIESCSNNLFTNADFEQGNTGFFIGAPLTEQLPTCTQVATAFKYGLCTNAHLLNNPWQRPAHNGISYFADDGPTPQNQLDVTLWEQTVNVVKFQIYCFTFWFTNIDANPGDQEPDIYYDFYGNSTGISHQGHTGGLDYNGTSGYVNGWYKVQFSWNSGNNTSVSVNLRSFYGGNSSSGNDVGMDDFIMDGPIGTPPTITASANSPICAGQPITLGVSLGSGGSVIWQPGGLTTSAITVTPTTTTTYTATVTDLCGSQFNTYTVNVIPFQPGFSYAPVSECVNDAINFINTTNTPLTTTYQWNFGDNTTSTATNPSHTYGAPGTYTITLTGTNACGSNTISIPINITPSTSTYNVNCCSSDPLINTYNFDEVNGPFVVTNPYTLSNPLIWAGQQYKIRGTITIMPGAKLIINSGSIIQFDPNSKIVVSPGAILQVNNSTLTGLQTCGTMWQGIEVWGNKTKTQIDIQIPATGQLWQGKVILNNSTVALAHNGVVLGRRQGSLFNTNFGGGILLATNSSFTNCGYGVRFIPYPFVNNSRIIDCAFSSTTLPDPGYNAFNSYTYPNAQNPIYGYANQTQRSYAFGLTLGVKFVQFKGNTFSNAEYGIIGVNSSLLVIPDANGTGNKFFQMNVGETHANIFTSPFYANRIENNLYSGPVYPILAWGGMIDKINNNDIRGAFVGIGLVNDRGYFVNDNLVGSSLGSCLVGISASNSGTMGGLIGRANSTTGNLFTSCMNGTMMGGNNSFLQVNCNTYVNPTAANYNTNWNNFGPLANQGNFPIINDQDPAGNTFAQFSPLRNQINSITLFDYYAHSADISGNPVTVIPTPTGSLTASNIINTGIQQTNTSCDPGPPCSNCSGRLSQLDGVILQLEAEKTIVQNQIDGGQTQQLLDAINSTMPSGQLENLLLTHSPLSDLVLFAYIAKNGTPPEIFKNVIVPNSPVSKDVRPALDAKIANMAPGIKNQIIAAQSNYSNRTLSVVDGELQNKIGERQQVYNQQMDYFVNESENNPLMKDSVYTLLVRQNTEAAKEAIVASYLADENYPSASIAIAALNPSTPEETSEKDFLTLMYNIYSGGRDVFEMNPVEEQQVRSLAGLADDYLARANARVILFVVFGEPLQLDINLNNSSRISDPTNSASSGQTETFLGESYPNPATDEVNIECNVPDGTHAVLKFFDMNGRLLTTKQLANGQQLVTLDVHFWHAGVYMYEMIVDDKIISYQKMVITNK